MNQWKLCSYYKECLLTLLFTVTLRCDLRKRRTSTKRKAKKKVIRHKQIMNVTVPEEMITSNNYTITLQTEVIIIKRTISLAFLVHGDYSQMFLVTNGHDGNGYELDNVQYRNHVQYCCSLSKTIYAWARYLNINFAYFVLEWNDSIPMTLHPLKIHTVTQ